MTTRRQFLGSLSLPAAVAVGGIPGMPPIFRRAGPDIVHSLSQHPGTAQSVARDEDFGLKWRGRSRSIAAW